MEQLKEQAIFSAGCFWGVEDAFRMTDGVTETEVGYTGGDVPNPTYEQVCTGKTHHAEAVKVVFNPDKISYEDLVRKFFTIHNPTTINMQGPDVGEQYRSAIFYNNEEQKQIAEKIKSELNQNNAWSKPIVTEIVPEKPFYKAEEYHQKYFLKNGGGVCHV
ncbi:MAG: peptide-methionine (S)-S-oxide reductase MsrA [Minisyncoccia bacterium]